MKFIFIPLASYFFAQTVKLFYLLALKRKTNGNVFTWAYVWAGEFPSAHAAVLAACLVLIYLEYGLGSIFGFSVFISLMFLYGFLEDKKRQSLLESYLNRSADPALRQIGGDKVLMGFSGHTVAEEIAGAFLGVAITITLLNIFK